MQDTYLGKVLCLAGDGEAAVAGGGRRGGPHRGAPAGLDPGNIGIACAHQHAFVACRSLDSFFGFPQWGEHVFKPEALQRIAAKAIASGNGNSTEVVNTVIDLLAAEYPGFVNKEQDWVFNNAGGAMGAMTVLHASLSEYVIIFGSAMGTEGHTGRFLADDWFTILHGEQWAALPGALEREVYKPGDQHHLKWGEAKQYKMPDACWALEYARGNIPSMLPFGFADSFSSTLDFHTLYHTGKHSCRAECICLLPSASCAMRDSLLPTEVDLSASPQTCPRGCHRISPNFGQRHDQIHATRQDLSQGGDDWRPQLCHNKTFLVVAVFYRACKRLLTCLTSFHTEHSDDHPELPSHPKTPSASTDEFSALCAGASVCSTYFKQTPRHTVQKIAPVL